MRRKNRIPQLIAAIGIAFCTLGAGAALALIVTPADVGPAFGSWHPANERDGGASAITGTQSDRLGGNGSLEQSLPAPASNSPKTDFEVFSADTTFGTDFQVPTGFGLLTDLTNISFDWWRASASTAPSHLTHALRMYVFDPDAGTNGSSYLVIWEGVYNGYPSLSGPVPTDTWTTEDATTESWWRIPQFLDGTFAGFSHCNTTPADCLVFDNSLTDWSFGPNTVVFGVNVGLGSGWAGSYDGFADLVTLNFDAGQQLLWDFELTLPTTTTTSATTTTTLAPTTTTAPTTTAEASTTTQVAVLPETGTADPQMLLFALVSFLGGAGLMFAARRRSI